MGFPITRLKNGIGGGGGVMTVGLAFLTIVVIYAVVLAILAVIASLSLWPAANATKITTQINNAIVIGAQFYPVIIILGVVGLILVMVGRSHRG
jgi:hypothetical protein